MSKKNASAKTKAPKTAKGKATKAKPEAETPVAPAPETTPKAETPTTPATETPAAPAARATRKAKEAKEAKPKKVSALDAAHKVLVAKGAPMTAPELIEAMATQGLWTSPGGKTPAATLYAAMLREITTKGKASRFARPERGKFAATAN